MKETTVTCRTPHPEDPTILCTLQPHEEGTMHAAEREELTTKLIADPTADLPKDAAGNDVTHDVDGNPVIPLVEVPTTATITYQWADA